MYTGLFAERDLARTLEMAFASMGSLGLPSVGFISFIEYKVDDDYPT